MNPKTLTLTLLSMTLISLAIYHSTSSPKLKPDNPRNCGTAETPLRLSDLDFKTKIIRGRKSKLVMEFVDFDLTPFDAIDFVVLDGDRTVYSTEYTDFERKHNPDTTTVFASIVFPASLADGDYTVKLVLDDSRVQKMVGCAEFDIAF